MAQLTSGVSSSGRSWHLDEIPDSRYLQCGSEVVEVLARYVTEGRVRVRRGAEGTTAATHADGAEVTAAYAVGSDGAEQLIRLFGPFTVAWNAEGISSNGHEVIDGALIADDAEVLDAWVVTTAQWETADALYLGFMNGEGGFRTVRLYDDMSLHVPGGGTQSWSEPTVAPSVVTRLHRQHRKVAAYGWGFGVLTDGAADSGEVKVFVLIAEPV